MITTLIKLMWDHQQQKIDKLKGLVLLTDESVCKEEMNELSAKQWSEYIRVFPDEQAVVRKFVLSEDNR